MQGKYTVTLIEGDGIFSFAFPFFIFLSNLSSGIGTEISAAVKDIYAAAKVGNFEITSGYAYSLTLSKLHLGPHHLGAR